MRVQKAVHVDNAAADGELAHPAHHGLFDKSVIQEPGPELGGLDNVAHLYLQYALEHTARLRELGKQSIQRAYHDKRDVLAGDVAEKLEAFFKDAFERNLGLVGFEA